MSEIQSLQPNLLWKWFDQICTIPRPSYHEEKIATFIVHWAKNKGFYVERDDAGNVLIRKAATKGMENHKSVALQAHLDMVPQANEETVHNFKTDPVKPYIDGEWVKAKGTTLGSDNGIGIASALAVLDSDDLAHPDLEVLLTMTEECGMIGAIGLRPHWLQSEILINTDTEETGQIYIGCAGGVNVNINFPLDFEYNQLAHSYQLVLKGLQGGHSGCDIHTGRANAIKVLARFLAELKQSQPNFHFALSELRGGSVRNAIPREAFATLAFNGDDGILKSAVQQFNTLLKAELSIAEPNLTFTLQFTDKPSHIFTTQTTTTAINLFNALPNGVMRNSDVIPDVVETSLSIGVLTTEKDHLKTTILTRSLIETGKQCVITQLRSLCTLAGANLELSNDYPGWSPQSNSPIVSLTRKIYSDLLGEEEASIKIIHAGLECGLLKKIYPNIDMISIGPTILNAHSPDEQVHIPGVLIYWQLLTHLLAQIPIRE